MAKTQLKLPSNPNAELFYDARRMTVGFRDRPSGKQPREAVSKVLRVVVQAFGSVVDDRIFDPGAIITAGVSRKNTLKIPTRDLPEFHPLLEYGQDGTTRLCINKFFTGILQMGDKLEQLTEAQAGSSPLRTVTLPRNSKGFLEHGNVVVYFEEIPAPDRVPPIAIIRTLGDPYFARWWVVSFALHLLILLVMKIMPAAPKEVPLEELAPAVKQIVVDPKRFARFTPPKQSMPFSGLKAGPVGMEGEGARAAGEEGRRGRGVPGSGRKVAGADIQRTGVLDFFSKGSKRGAFSDLVGGGAAIPGSVESEFNRNARYGLPGERELREGKGLQGGGKGGGGLSTSIGQGLGTKGRGGGAKGTGLADFGTGRSDTAVSASIDEEEVFITGNIPKEVIAKIMRDHQGEIQYCYQKQVQLQPDLRGKIVTDFIIGLEGRVTSTKIKQTTMQSPPVESCVLGVIRRIQFPKPGGGVVEVIYPYLFRVAG